MTKKQHDEWDGLGLPFRSNIVLLATPPHKLGSGLIRR